VKSHSHKRTVAAAAAALTLAAGPLFASSHQDAPLAILDPAANTTDVYAFVDQDEGVAGPARLHDRDAGGHGATASLSSGTSDALTGPFGEMVDTACL